MITITATHFRSQMFKLLKKVAQGEIISIQRNGREVCRLSPPPSSDWRDQIRSIKKPKAKSSKVFAPLKGAWNR